MKTSLFFVTIFTGISMLGTSSMAEQNSAPVLRAWHAMLGLKAYRGLEAGFSYSYKLDLAQGPAGELLFHMWGFAVGLAEDAQMKKAWIQFRNENPDITKMKPAMDREPSDEAKSLGKNLIRVLDQAASASTPAEVDQIFGDSQNLQFNPRILPNSEYRYLAAGIFYQFLIQWIAISPEDDFTSLRFQELLKHKFLTNEAAVDGIQKSFEESLSPKK